MYKHSCNEFVEYRSIAQHVLLSGEVVSEMTYTVSSGTLNSTVPYHTIPYLSGESTFYYSFVAIILQI